MYADTLLYPGSFDGVPTGTALPNSLFRRRAGQAPLCVQKKNAGPDHPGEADRGAVCSSKLLGTN